MYIDSLEKLKEKFAREIDAGDISIFEKNRKRMYVTIMDKQKTVEAARFLFVDQKLRLSTVSGVDLREGIELLYHFSDDRSGTVISIRTMAAKPQPRMPSTVAFMPSALWIEMEIHEMLGLDFEGHPHLKKLLLPDDWPEGVYPLRKGR